MLSQAAYNTSAICYEMGIRHVVISPGSRNAPLTISFARNQKIEKIIIPDERAAGFIALGIAQETRRPVVVCCTSGTALLNYAPAIAEAYYRQIPLIVLSADRPPSLIDQRDGQTIRQFEALKNHVKSSHQLPIASNGTMEDYQKELISAISGATQTLPHGPVHINVPFDEPFYPTETQRLAFDSFQITKKEETTLPIPKVDFGNYGNILILIGQQDHNAEISEALAKISSKIPVLRAPLSNIYFGISHYDAFIDDQAELRPDVLITSGLSVLSKKLKSFLRKNKPKLHLHFDPAGVQVDTYQTHPVFIKSNLSEHIETLSTLQVNPLYVNAWKKAEENAQVRIQDYMSKTEFSEAKASKTILDALPPNSTLHLSNSMPVRYAELFGVAKGHSSYCNRGTSGIDGCTSTALGASLASNNLHILMTGDIAFFYDRNAFFHNYKTPNFRVILMNNKGGGIFRLINGPAALPELEDYFETRHNRSAKYLCEENGLEYTSVSNLGSLTQTLSAFYNTSENAKILEIFTEPETNHTVYKGLRNYLYEKDNN